MLIKSLLPANKTQVTPISTTSRGDENVRFDMSRRPDDRPPHIRVAEVFSGSGRLSEALRRHGINTAEFDLKMSVAHDMSNYKKVTQLLLEWQNTQVQYLHFAPPCNSFSQARWPKIRCSGFQLALPKLQTLNPETL